jgi:hypothetical protein
LSPGYQHSPVFRLTIEPEFGMPLVVTRLPWSLFRNKLLPLRELNLYNVGSC